MNCRHAVALVVLASTLAPAALQAQPLASLAAARPPGDAASQPETTAPPPLTLSFAEGRVDVVRAGGVAAAIVPDVLDEGDRLVVGDGRAELVFDDGTLVHADVNTDIRLVGGRLELVRGRLVIHVPPGADGERTVVTPAGLVRMAPHGQYELRAADLDGETVVAVIDGRATLAVADTDLALRPGDAVALDPRARQPRWERAASADAFRLWSGQRADRATLARAGATLPPAAQPWLSDLAANGTWSTVPPYGAVWFPSVGPGWRPFSDGTWRNGRRGWIWIDRQRWGWPVHHYGRWGYLGTRGWYWIPRRRWSPGSVQWLVGTDFVGWAPLDAVDRPVVDFHAGRRGGAASLWSSSWSIVPRHRLGQPRNMREFLEDPARLPGPVAGGFVSQMIGPRGPAAPGSPFAARPWTYAPRQPGAAVIDAPLPRAVMPRETAASDLPRRRPIDAPRAQAPASLAPDDGPRRRGDASNAADAGETVQRHPRPIGPPVPPPAEPSGGGSTFPAARPPGRGAGLPGRGPTRGAAPAPGQRRQPAPRPSAPSAAEPSLTAPSGAAPDRGAAAGAPQRSRGRPRPH